LVGDFIVDRQWNLPADFYVDFPEICKLVQQVIIPIQQVNDKLVWIDTTNGSLSFKDAYVFKDTYTPAIHWAKCIWSPHIPPSKSLLTWRLMNDKMPVDGNLKQRGCAMPSICSLCMLAEENIFHLFFECSYVVPIW